MHHAQEETPPTNRGQLVWRWIATGSALIGRQGAIHLTAAAASLLFVRLMPKAEYAKYTVGLSIIMFVQAICDLGLSSTVVAVGGKRSEDFDYLAKVRSATIDLRMILLAGAICLAVPYSVIVAARQGWGYLDISPLTLLAIVYGAVQLSVSTDNSLLKILAKVSTIQRAELNASLVKLLGAVTMAAGHATGLMGMAVMLFGIGTQAFTVRTALTSFRAKAHEAGDAVKDEILRFAKPLIAPSGFYAVYGQVTLWSLSLVGGTVDLAGLGAIGRVVQVLAVFTVTIQIAVHPHFALEKDCRRLRKNATVLATALVLGGAIVAASSFVFSDVYLLALGAKYSDLGPILWIGMLAATLVFIDSALYGSTLAAGNSAYQWATIPAHLVGLIVGISVSFPKTLKSALLFDLIRVIPALIVQVIIFSYTFYALVPRRVSMHEPAKAEFPR